MWSCQDTVVLGVSRRLLTRRSRDRNSPPPSDTLLWTNHIFTIGASARKIRHSCSWREEEKRKRGCVEEGARKRRPGDAKRVDCRDGEFGLAIWSGNGRAEGGFSASAEKRGEMEWTLQNSHGKINHHRVQSNKYRLSNTTNMNYLPNYLPNNMSVNTVMPNKLKIYHGW